MLLHPVYLNANLQADSGGIHLTLAHKSARATQRAIIVSHTHWDRAWYVPFQEFRIHLVKLVDRLIEVLRSDPDFRCFMLDGQMIVLEDYLEVRPEQRHVLEELVRAGRVQVGPWYVLADEFLVSPESLIRNLLIGRQIAESFGPVLSEGYSPDSFGHIGQLPQILRGFGIDSAFFSRGLGDEGEVLGGDFWWSAPDGTEVYAHWMPGGYSNIANLGYPLTWGDLSRMSFDMHSAVSTIENALDGLRPYSRTGNYLLLNGVDHSAVQAEVPEVIERANALIEGIGFEQATLTDYKRLVLGSGVDLPRHTGELRQGRYSPILQGVYSSRMYIKQANEAAQTLLERYAEPLAAVSRLLGGDDHRPLLKIAWKTLLKNHPHDDICGCSVDAVHDGMMARFSEVDQIGRALVRLDSSLLAAAVRVRPDAGTPVVVFNPTGWSRTEVVTGTIHLELDDPCVHGFTIEDDAGRPVAHQVSGERDVFWMEVLNPHRKRQITLSIPVADVPGPGYRTYYLKPGTEQQAAESQPGVTLTERGMENEHLKLAFNADGSLDITDKTTGRVYSGLHAFEDTEDAGDEYTYSPAPRSQTVASAGSQVRLTPLASGPVHAEYRVEVDLQLPIALTRDRQGRSAETRAVTLASVFSLATGERLVRVSTTVDNTVLDHRLRVLFPTGVETAHVHAGGHFDVVRRPADTLQVTGWKEEPSRTAHALGFVDASDGASGLAVLNPGLPEYEAIREADGEMTIALTLLRCTGWLSRPDLPSRPGNAGPEIETPGGQCQGYHRFEYAIAPHSGDWEQVYALAGNSSAPMSLVVCPAWSSPEQLSQVFPEHLRHPITATIESAEGVLPEKATLLRIEPASVVLSTLKPGEADGSVVARFYSLAPEPVRASVETYWELDTAYRSDMDERNLQRLEVLDGHRVELNVRPREVITLVLYGNAIGASVQG